MVAPNLVQSNGQATASTTFTYTTGNLTAHSTAVVVMGEFDSSTTETITGIQLGGVAQPGAYVAVFPQTLGGGSGQGCACIVVPDVVAGQNAVSWTYSGTSVIGTWGCEVANLGPFPMVDTSTIPHTGTGSPNSTGTTPASTQPPAFVLAAASDFNGTSATPSGTTWTGGTDLGVGGHLSVGWLIQSAAGQTYSWTQVTGGTVGWADFIVTLYAGTATRPPIVAPSPAATQSYNW
jgi:hypothetical protein